MKVIHSWLQMDSHHHQDKFFYQMTLLSILAAKKSFGNIHLYTNEEGKKHFEKFNFPYDSISTELEGIDVERGGFAIGKIKTYTLQEEPYIHIDHDTFLFEGRHLPESYRFYFGFTDMQMPFNMKTWLAANETYFETYNNFSDLFDETFFEYTNFDIIPNASIFGGSDFKTITSIYKILLELYFDNKERFNDRRHSSALLEQFLFFPMGELLFEDIQCRGRWIQDNSYIWSQSVPLIIDRGKVKIHGNDFMDIENDKIEKFGYKTECYDSKIRILIDNWFGGFLHMGHFKDDVTMRWVMLEKLKKYYDADKYLKTIDEVFPEKYAWETNIFSSLL